ncbi:hypothetical protein RF11_00745 [Thelohanellus kitauei]|uniref:Uncharacterized protein n=1 Tax=Thelohanellus kitauei TaxID=669202 RepID=A0A0C2N3B5_THEKT|nr:hypothetical protein RF11_00745 [Thelohanellus kitauei]
MNSDDILIFKMIQFREKLISIIKKILKMKPIVNVKSDLKNFIKTNNRRLHRALKAKLKEIHKNYTRYSDLSKSQRSNVRMGLRVAAQKLMGEYLDTEKYMNRVAAKINPIKRQTDKWVVVQKRIMKELEQLNEELRNAKICSHLT